MESSLTVSLSPMCQGILSNALKSVKFCQTLQVAHLREHSPLSVMREGRLYYPVLIPDYH